MVGYDGGAEGAGGVDGAAGEVDSLGIEVRGCEVREGEEVG